MNIDDPRLVLFKGRRNGCSIDPRVDRNQLIAEVVAELLLDKSGNPPPDQIGVEYVERTVTPLVRQPSGEVFAAEITQQLRVLDEVALVSFAEERYLACWQGVWKPRLLSEALWEALVASNMLPDSPADYGIRLNEFRLEPDRPLRLPVVAG